MTYMKMTRGPESSTSHQPPQSEQPTGQTISIKNNLKNLMTLFSSMLLALTIVMNLIPSLAARSSISFDSKISVGETMIVFLLAIIIYSAVRLIQMRLFSSRPASEPILKESKPQREPATTETANQLLKLSHSAEQLSEVELLLIQKLGVNHRTDRVTDKLICKLQICTNRMLAQIDDLSDEFAETKKIVEVDNKSDNEKMNKNEKKRKKKETKTTVLQFWL